MLVSLLFCTAMAVAQVTKLSIDASANSIVRSVDGDYVLVYTEDVSGDGYFLLYRDGDPTAMAFQVMSDVHVRDVRIYDGKTAYFCGRDAFYDWGVVGMFDIASVFAGTDDVYYGGCNWSSGTWCLKPTDLKRLDLFDSAGVVGMAMVGDIETYLNFYENGTTVASAWFDGSWNMCAYLNKGNSFYFTDVACLEKSIVAVGNDHTGYGCRIKTFKPALHFPEFYHVYTPGFAQSINFLSPVGDVLATRAGKDTVLIAHYDNDTKVKTVLHRVKINPATGIPLAPVDTWYTDIPSVVSYSSGWELLELADSGHSAYLLQNAKFPTVTGLVHRLSRIPMLASPSSADLWKPLYGRQQSMDLDAVTLEPRLSGIDNNLVLHAPIWLPQDGGCYEYAPLPVKPASASIDTVLIPEDAMHPNVYTVFDSPKLLEVPAEIICLNAKGKEEKR